MTPAELLAELPNGFHDALLRELNVDYARGEVRLSFDFLVGSPDGATEEEREATRPGVLRLGGITSMTMEPPDPRYRLSDAEGVRVDGGFGPWPGEAEPHDDARVRLWLFVCPWNARMIVYAHTCALAWE